MKAGFETRCANLAGSQNGEGVFEPRVKIENKTRVQRRRGP